MPEVAKKFVHPLEDDVIDSEYDLSSGGWPLEAHSWLCVADKRDKSFSMIGRVDVQVGAIGGHYAVAKREYDLAFSLHRNWYEHKAPMHSPLRFAGGGYASVNLDPAIETQFRILTENWRAERRGVSSTERMLLCPSYQRIIGLGLASRDQVIRLILRELQERPDFWFAALRTLSGDDPVMESDRGNVRRMADAWLIWGREKNYIEPLRYRHGRVSQFNP